MNAPPQQSALNPAGPLAASILDVTLVITVGATLIFLGVMGLLWLAVRRREGAAVNTRLWVIGGGFVFPLAVLVALFFYSVRHAPPWRAVPPSDALIVGVTGHMWWWSLRYRDPASDREIATANEIRIPVGRPVYLGLTSADVIHSFWVPALGGKMDMLPGRVQHLLVQADRPGIYRGQCAEYCGAQHARMALQVVAMAPADFERWLHAQVQDAAPADTPALVRGRQAFIAQRCGACHTVRGVTAESRLGPDLTHVGSRLQLGAAEMPNEPATMINWIAHVQQIKPGARMPSGAGRVDDESMRAIALWLSHLK
ncbi:cytochrome c oxidase subunit II [Variovorax sp. UMC13]|uniref:cytochrome c oxidase subunit II n=1 Tax=Variovorax sp. UMC13 TaxID=1862326 RepID=UPI0015FEC90C|nr:cytochrome c oxidase subunit II [Variovorax sp. UMC13]MBB1600412.1 cytochrome c oxidase subunit II [Variovorax sp. UMC13]